MKSKNKKNKINREIKDYDETDVSAFINGSKSLKFEDLGLQLPKQPTTQVVSIRLPTWLLNQIKAFGSQRDIPYQALIKQFLAESMDRMRKKLA